MEILVLVISFIILLIIGVPIAFSLGISSILTMLISMDFISAFATAAQRMATGLDSFALLAIPFFVLAGEILNRGGIAEKLLDFATVLVGRFRGGLAYVIIISAMLIGAVSGSALAAVAAIGGIMVPIMVKKGYDKGFSAAINITSSTTGLSIPPSNVLIVYSFASGGTSIAALFLAGYMPGVLVGVGLIVVAAIFAFVNDYPKSGKVAFKEAVKKFLGAIPAILLVIIVIGGIIAGYFTPTEASAIAVAYAAILAGPIYKNIKLKEIPNILLKSASTTAIVMLLIGTSMALSWIMSYENIPQMISQALLGLTNSKIAILLIINFILLIVGTFMDMTPAILIFTPIFLPVVTRLGLDPVHFGIIIVLNLCIGLCTPPVGSVLFVGTEVANTKIENVLKPLIPMYAIMILVLLMVTFIPQISLFIPGLFGF
ncbi:MAG: TRAP transporter large permease [Candidatus Marinimicrobia bacterium]|nr:TRAP transporter large permease [Candidatus Neomarinimicrobiota bacterium]